MSVLNAIFQGIIQGLTEFLPVSSSGHLSLVQYFTGQGGETGALFSIILHLGTLLAVFLAFRGTIWGLICEFFAAIGDIFKGKFSFKKARPQRRMLFLLVVAMLPMALTVVFRKDFAVLSSDNSILAEGLCFLLTSGLLFLCVKVVGGRKNASNMRYRDAVAVGFAQAVAPMPGLSRSGSTISVGVMMGLDRKFAVAFSFIMGIPAVMGAAVLELGDVSAQTMPPAGAIVAGLITSFLFGLLAIKMVNWLVTSDKFKYFAWYTLILGALVTVVAIIEKSTGGAIQQFTMGLLK